MKSIDPKSHLLSNRHDLRMDAILAMARIVQGLKDDMRIKFTISVLQFRKSHLIAHKKSTFMIVDIKIQEVDTRRIVIQVTGGVKSCVVSIHDFSFWFDHIK